MREPAFWWGEGSLASALLAPLAALYGAVAQWRLGRGGRRAAAPVVCVGNLTVGGAGNRLVTRFGRVDDGVFFWDTAVDAIRRKVRRRVEDYAGERDAWFRDWFEPMLGRIDVRCLSWEDVIEVIAFHEPEAGQLIDTF